MHGIIVIDKPVGPTSAEVVRLVKGRLGRAVRVGHLGTLDPFATGVLPILIGEGTKLAPFLQEGEKEYEGLIKLGTETDTLDRTGTPTRTATVPTVEAAQLKDVARQFTGQIVQTPPIFSAIKRAGVPLYKLARKGLEVEAPAPRKVEIFELELANSGADQLHFRVVCSSGMYVRSLARDIGLALSTAAHLDELRRLRNGSFSLVEAIPLATTLEVLERRGDPGLISLRAALAAIPEVEVESATERSLRNGDSRALDGLAPRDAELFKVIAGGNLIALAAPVSRLTSSIARIFNVP